MAVPEKVSVDEAQQYYDTADSIRIRPGLDAGRGAANAGDRSPTCGDGLRWSRW